MSETTQESMQKDEIKFINEQPYKRDPVAISIPSNHLELIDNTVNEYKKWLKENEKFQEQADEAETEEERQEALRLRTVHFKSRYSGVVSKDTGIRLSPSKIKKMWEKFIQGEYRDFLQAHVNLQLEDILTIGVDKFFYVMGWTKPSDVPTWRNNKLRVGYCCHCRNTFIPMILQYNHGLCMICKQLYSEKAIRNYIIRTLNTSDRYQRAQHDMMMDFHIMFYHSKEFRQLFLAEDSFAKDLETAEEQLPDWYETPAHLRPDEEGNHE